MDLLARISFVHIYNIETSVSSRFSFIDISAGIPRAKRNTRIAN